jgi:hypothetical protein
VRAEKAAQDARQKELDAREARIKLIEEDPVRFFEEYKADPKAFLEKLAGEHKPERVLEKQVASLSQKLDRIDQEKQQREAAAAAQAQRAQGERVWQEACGVFIAQVAENAAKYPHLVAEFTEAEAAHEAWKALYEVIGQDADGKPLARGEAYRRQFGDYPDNEVIAEFVDARAKARAEGRSKSGWSRRQSDDDSAPSEGKTSGDPKPAAQTVRGSSPRTLTSRDSSKKATAPKAWTQEAADEESLRILEGAYRKS